MTAGEIIELHRRPPSAAAFMARALLPSPGVRADGGLPSIVQRWAGLKIDPAHLAAFGRATGLATQDGVPILYPHVLGFRLQMALLTHRAYPLPIWTVLQVRNRLVRHRRIEPGERLQLETRIGAHRVVEKGLEIDLHSRLEGAGDCCWESQITYFHRGRFGTAFAQTPRPPSPAIAGPTTAQRFEMARGGGLGFGKLTGDYNGIHYWPWYAMRLGFRTAFSHPQRVAGLCLARLREPDSEAQSLDLWIKGPVYYGAKLTLTSCAEEGGIHFGLSLAGENRPALAGWWRAGPVAPGQATGESRTAE